MSECPDTLQYKGKTEAESSEVEEARKGKRATGGSTGHHGCGDHHGQAVAATMARGAHCRGGFLVAPERRVLVFLVLRLGPQVFAFLGVFWASSCYHLLILMAHTSLA